jgi:hypothetical protein
MTVPRMTGREADRPLGVWCNWQHSGFWYRRSWFESRYPSQTDERPPGSPGGRSRSWRLRVRGVPAPPGRRLRCVLLREPHPAEPAPGGREAREPADARLQGPPRADWWGGGGAAAGPRPPPGGGGGRGGPPPRASSPSSRTMRSAGRCGFPYPHSWVRKGPHIALTGTAAAAMVGLTRERRTPVPHHQAGYPTPQASSPTSQRLVLRHPRTTVRFPRTPPYAP